ncbi:MAG: hypothetical protein AB1454_12825 [Candidatus Auribacterota bacterium]
MLKKLSIIACLFVLIATQLGCVSEAVNKSIGNLMNDPEALETPENPDEPLFDPQSEDLIKHNRNQELQDRFENVSN